MGAARITSGSVRVLVAFDIAHSVRIEECSAHVAELAPDERIRHKGHAPGYFQFDPPPLRLVRGIEPLGVGGHATEAQVELLLYDFGGASVGYAIPFAGTLEELVELSCALSADERLRAHAASQIEALLALVGPHVDRPGMAQPTEDYFVFQVRELEGGADPDRLLREHAGDLARVLRSERAPLSDQEVQEALASPVRFGKDDLALFDWNAALLFDREPEDVVSVLEYANLQLLELRFLDGRLDTALDRAWEAMQPARGFAKLRPLRGARAEMRRIAQMEVDGAILFERVSNALKLVGEQYLARVYRTASQRFRLAEWNAAILRKLETLESIYQKSQDHASSLRMEALEWIIIVLIMVSIALPLLGLGH